MRRLHLALACAAAFVAAGCASTDSDRDSNASSGADQPSSGSKLVRVDPLNGKTYAVTLRRQGSSDPGDVMTDRLIFSNGTFESTVCTNAGFKTAPYATRMVAGGFAFDVECDSPTMGHTVWHGVADADRVHGTVTRTPKDGGVPIVSKFSGDIVR